jgi:hypothetical protein
MVGESLGISSESKTSFFQKTKNTLGQMGIVLIVYNLFKGFYSVTEADK